VAGNAASRGEPASPTGRLTLRAGSELRPDPVATELEFGLNEGFLTEVHLGLLGERFHLTLRRLVL